MTRVRMDPFGHDGEADEEERQHHEPDKWVHAIPIITVSAVANAASTVVTSPIEDVNLNATVPSFSRIVVIVIVAPVMPLGVAGVRLRLLRRRILIVDIFDFATRLEHASG
ncbi:hypothetical protein ATCC90586_010408 [Pythium insidiosum]|nr:hypothetical protein ATCC90586_010408 [Pythium insidiosum]